VLASKSPTRDSLADRSAEADIDSSNHFNARAEHERAARAADFKARTVRQRNQARSDSIHRRALASALLIGSLE